MHVVVSALAVVLSATGTLAQTFTSSFTTHAHIPFAFVVQNDSLPAGNYLVQIPGANPGPLMIRQIKDNKEEFILQVPVYEEWSGRPKLTFDKIGSVYYLVQVSDPWASSGSYRARVTRKRKRWHPRKARVIAAQ